MNQITASESRIVLPRQIAQEPSINRLIEIFPIDDQVLAPKARIVFATIPIEQLTYQKKRTACHYLLQKLLCSISATQQQRWQLTHSDTGAPALEGGENRSLSISMARSGHWLAAGVALEAGIGIDIECIKPRTNISEKAAFLNWKVPVDDIQDFYAKWTLWEASAKCVEGSVLMRKNPGFDKLCRIDTRDKVANSGAWTGLHDCLDEKVFYAVVLQSGNPVQLSHQILHPETAEPWPISNNQHLNNHHPIRSVLS